MKYSFCIADYSGCGLYRVVQPASVLKSRGHDVNIYDQVSPELLKNSDVIVLQRQGAEAVYKIMEKVRHDNPNTVFIYDIDDFFHGIGNSNPAFGIVGKPKSPILQSIERFMSFCDVLTVSTVPLAENYSRFNPNVVVSPNGVNSAVFNYTKSVHPHPTLNIGWQGSRTHYADIAQCAGALKRILAKYPETKLVFFGFLPINLFLDVPYNRYSYIPDIDVFSFPYALSSLDLDISLVPVAPTEFNRCKSNLKWMEFGTIGLPAVASDFGPYQCIRDGVDGLLAKTEDEWFTHIETLINDKEKREMIGRAAKARIEKEFTPDLTADGYEKAVNLVLSKRRIAAETLPASEPTTA